MSMRKRQVIPVLLVLTTLLMGSSSAADYRTGSIPKQETQLIYSSDPHDSWNRIFSLLFTRTVELRLTNDFPEGSPFHSPAFPLMPNSSLTVSSRTFSRIESGDRAIDPLYYSSYLDAQGTEWFLREPQYEQFDQALTEALAENRQRPALQRALMQSDIWAAYDRLGAHSWGDAATDEKAKRLLSRLAQFVAKLALTPAEIAQLPANYKAAQRELNLPALFDTSSGWIEIEWNPRREHDANTAYRRATRIFLKPASSTKPFIDELDSLLDTSRGRGLDLSDRLDAVALVMENMLVDTESGVEPSPLIFDFQIRRFVRDSAGKLERSEAEQYELNRKALLNRPSSGGLMRSTENDPAYLPQAMNDYGFATPMFGSGDFAVLATLRHRCEGCHFENLIRMPTFPSLQDPNALYWPLPVHQLDPAADPHGKYVAEQKMRRPGFIGMIQRSRGEH